MKKTIVICLFIINLAFQVSGQKSWEDLKSGKYFKNSKKNLYTGSWVSNEKGKEIEFLITAKKTRLKTPPYDFFVDALFINVIKYMYKGEDIAKKLDDSIRLIGTSDRPYFEAMRNEKITNYADTLTYVLLNLKLETLGRDSLLFTAKPFFSGSPEAVFYPSVILTRKKKK